jgi:hypothetical protein
LKPIWETGTGEERGSLQKKEMDELKSLVAGLAEKFQKIQIDH